jgi:hypothetical protein
MLEDDPERFPCAAASWHARWCIDLAPLTLTESQTARARHCGRSPSASHAGS